MANKGRKWTRAKLVDTRSYNRDVNTLTAITIITDSRIGALRYL